MYDSYIRSQKWDSARIKNSQWNKNQKKINQVNDETFK